MTVQYNSEKSEGERDRGNRPQSRINSLFFLNSILLLMQARLMQQKCYIRVETCTEPDDNLYILYKLQGYGCRITFWKFWKYYHTVFAHCSFDVVGCCRPKPAILGFMGVALFQDSLQRCRLSKCLCFSFLSFFLSCSFAISCQCSSVFPSYNETCAHKGNRVLVNRRGAL